MSNIQSKLLEVRNRLVSTKDSRNNFGGYNYRNAETMLTTLNPLMKKYGLTLDFSDDLILIGDRYYVKTTCTVHDIEDNESYSTTAFAREALSRKGNDDAQVTGGAMTYCHKYALMGMFAISDNKMDPDSMAAPEMPQQPQQTAQTQQTPQYTAKVNGREMFQQPQAQTEQPVNTTPQMTYPNGGYVATPPQIPEPTRNPNYFGFNN